MKRASGYHAEDPNYEAPPEEPEDEEYNKPPFLDEDDLPQGTSPYPVEQPSERPVAKKAQEQWRVGGPRPDDAPRPPAVPGRYPISLGPWGHEPSSFVKLPKQAKPCLPHQSMYGYEKDPAMAERRQELVKQVREELGPDALEYFSGKTSFGVREVDMVLKLKCMQGARVAVNGQPQGSHHSGILEKDGKEVRCEQCAEEGLAAAAKANGHSWTWTPLQALQHACWKRGRFAWHCTGLDKSKHPDVLELVDVRLSLRAFCILVSQDVSASLHYCVYCRGHLLSPDTGRLQTIYTCASCTAAFHEDCYKDHTLQFMSSDPNWRCACCAGGLPAGIAAGDGRGGPVRRIISGAPDDRQYPPAAHRQPAAQRHWRPAPQQQQQQQGVRQRRKLKQQQQEEQTEDQPSCLEDDPSNDKYLNMYCSSDDGLELEHTSSGDSGHQAHDGDGEEVVSPRGRAPFAPGFPTVFASLARCKADDEQKERLSPQQSPNMAFPTAATPSSAGDGARRRRSSAATPPAPAAGGFPPLPLPGTGVGRSRGLAGMDTKGDVSLSGLPAGKGRAADRRAEQRNVWGPEYAGGGAAGGIRKRAAEQREASSAGARPAAGPSPGKRCPSDLQLGEFRRPAVGTPQLQGKGKEQEQTPDSSNYHGASTHNKPPRGRTADQQAQAAAAAAAFKRRKQQLNQMPGPPPAGGTGGLSLRQVVERCRWPPGADKELPGGGAVGASRIPGRAHASNQPPLPAKPSPTPPLQQRRKQQQQVGQGQGVPGAPAVVVPRQLQEASDSPGGGGQGARQKRQRQGQGQGSNPGSVKKLRQVPADGEAAGQPVQGVEEDRMVGVGKRAKGGPHHDLAVPGPPKQQQKKQQPSSPAPTQQQQQPMQQQPAPLLEKDPSPQRQPAANQPGPAAEVGSAADAAAAMDIDEQQEREAAPPAPQDNLTTSDAPEAPPGAGPATTQPNTDAAAAAAAAAQEPAARQPPLPLAAAGMPQHRDSSSAGAAHRLPTTQAAGATLMGVAAAATGGRGNSEDSETAQARGAKMGSPPGGSSGCPSVVPSVEAPASAPPGDPLDHLRLPSYKEKQQQQQRQLQVNPAAADGTKERRLDLPAVGEDAGQSGVGLELQPQQQQQQRLPSLSPEQHPSNEPRPAVAGPGLASQQGGCGSPWATPGSTLQLASPALTPALPFKWQYKQQQWQKQQQQKQQQQKQAQEEGQEEEEQGQGPHQQQEAWGPAPSSNGAVPGNTLSPVMGDPAGRQPTRDSPGIANKQPSPAAKQPPRDAVDSRAAGPDGAVSSGDEQVMGAAASPAAAAAQDGAANSTPGTAAAAVSAVPQQEQEEEAPDPESVLRRLLAKRGRTEFEKLYVHALLRDHEATLPPDLVAEARARCALPPRSAGKAAAAAAAAGGGGGRGRGRGRLPARANDDDFPSPQLSSSSSEEGAAAGASGARPRHTPGSGSPGGRRDRQRVHGRERATQYRRQRRAKVSGSPSGKAGQLPDAGLQAQGLHDDDADCADWMARLDDDDDEQMGSDMDMPFPHQMPEQPAGQPGRRAKRAKGQGAAPAGSPPQQAAGTPPPSDVAGPSLLDYLAAVAADAEAQLG